VQGVSATRATLTEADLQRAAFYEPDRAELVREALKPQHSLEVGQYLGVSRYTTREYLDVEVRLFEKAEPLAAGSELRLDPSGVERALDSAAGSRLSWSLADLSLRPLVGGRLKITHQAA
jgi:hypothetical protein